MVASANTFKTSNVLYIQNINELKALFPGFVHVDDYLSTHQKTGIKADLKALVEGVLVLNQTAAAYIGAAGYPGLRSRVWDNIFTLTILGENTVLRTEEVRVLRLLNVIEKIASNDSLLDTAAGIYSAYMSMVLLPGDVFPMPPLALPVEPTTQPEPPDPNADNAVELQKLQEAYSEIVEAYDRQTYEYRQLHYPKRDESNPDDSLQKNLLEHDALALSHERVGLLKSSTIGVLTKLLIKEEFVYMPQVHERIGSEIRRLGRLVNSGKERRTVVRVGGSLIMLGNECVNPSLESPCKPFKFEKWPGGAGHVRPIGVADLKVVQTQLYKYEAGEVAHVENVLQGEIRKRTFRDLNRQESTLEQEQETTTENVKETSTTERFELHMEANNVVQQDQASQIGASVTASYGTVTGSVSGTVSAGASSSTSQLDASAQATTYAKEVMERALQRVIEKTRTKRSVTTIVENEQTTEHSFDNTAATGAGGTDHIAGYTVGWIRSTITKW